MAPQLTEDEIDDLVYLARVGENGELSSVLASLADREAASPAEILLSAKDSCKSTALHMACGNGHTGTWRIQPPCSGSSLLLLLMLRR